MNTKRVILCADDYGFNAQVSAGIIELLKAQRLSAVSCMTNMPAWKTQALYLNAYKHNVDIGLHFNLTDGSPLTAANSFCSKQNRFFPLKTVISKAYTRQLNKHMLKQELKAQIAAFMAELGVLPNFIDGHQHIQQLPVIRQALIEVYQELKLQGKSVYIRLSMGPTLPKRAKIKALFIRLLGANTWRKKLVKAGIPHNSSFSGIYDFSDSAQYAEIFPDFLTDVNTRGIVMCHPGGTSSDPQDSIRLARVAEYNYFNSEQFIAACQQAGCQLSRFH